MEPAVSIAQLVLRLDGPGIESRRGRNFPHPSGPALGPIQPPTQWLLDLFPRIRRPGRGVNHSTPSSAEVKETVALFFYSPSWPS